MSKAKTTVKPKKKINEKYILYNYKPVERLYSIKLHKLKCRKTLRKNSFSQRIINVWNGLPGDVVESTTINRFKSGLEKWWKDAPDKYDDNPNQTKPWIGTIV